MKNFIKKLLYFLPNFLLKAGLGVCAIKMASIFKYSFVIGSSHAMFSGTTAATPLVGLFAGGLVSFAICASSILLRYVLFGMGSLHLFAFYIPGLFAGFYFAYENKITRLFVPIVCMLLFLLHPVGRQAFAYCLFWLIPVGIYFVRSNTIFLHTLASSFIAHAVGSVIWIYTMPMTAGVWYALIPIVCLERLVIASGMAIFYMGICFIKNKFAIFSRMYKMPIKTKVS